MKQSKTYWKSSEVQDILAENLGRLSDSKDFDSRILSIKVSATGVDPYRWFAKTSGTDNWGFLWHHPTNHKIIAAHTPLHFLRATGPNRFKEIGEQFKYWQQRTISAGLTAEHTAPLFMVGAFSFYDFSNASPWRDFGAASWFIPKYQFQQNGQETYFIINVMADAARNPEYIANEITDLIESWHIYGGKSNPIGEPEKSSSKNTLLYENGDHGYLKWIRGVEQAKSRIEQGIFDKIVLARQQKITFADQVNPLKTVQQLSSIYPDCSNFLFQNPNDQYFIGSSPEILASFQDGRLQTESLAGSVKRGQNEKEDAELADNLVVSTKNRSEHNYVVQSICRELNPLAKSIDCKQEPKLKKLPNVQHLHTPIEAEMRPGIHPMEVLEHLHPTPAVGGSPKRNITGHIQDIENLDRGLYAGPIGWFNSKNEGTLAVAIRSGLLYGQQARLYAGCGIVKDSDPHGEWEETQLKLRPLLDSLHGS